jgi:hypothetical protein
MTLTRRTRDLTKGQFFDKKNGDKGAVPVTKAVLLWNRLFIQEAAGKERVRKSIS